jgi:hypothetical protein
MKKKLIIIFGFTPSFTRKNAKLFVSRRVPSQQL